MTVAAAPTTSCHLKAFTAKHSGLCPLCDRRIVGNRSMVVRLPAPMRPQVLERRDGGRRWCVSAVTGKHFYADGHCPPDRPRRYAHQGCWMRWCQQGGAA